MWDDHRSNRALETPNLHRSRAELHTRAKPVRMQLQLAASSAGHILAPRCGRRSYIVLISNKNDTNTRMTTPRRFVSIVDCLFSRCRKRLPDALHGPELRAHQFEGCTSAPGGIAKITNFPQSYQRNSLSEDAPTRLLSPNFDLR